MDGRAGYEALRNRQAIDYLEHVVDLTEQVQLGFEAKIFPKGMGMENLIQKYKGTLFGMREFMDDLEIFFEKPPFVATRTRDPAHYMEAPRRRPLYDFTTYYISYIEFCYDSNSESIDCPPSEQQAIVTLATVEDYRRLHQGVDGHRRAQRDEGPDWR